jgi:hypothetical protein
MATLTRIYGFITLVYGGVLRVAAYAGSILPASILTHPNATPAIFIIAALLGVPAICTYTTSGLNTEESAERDPEAHRRHREPGVHCPAWPFIWYGMLVVIGIAWLLAVTIPNSVPPFFAFSGAFATFAGVWTLYVYPIAKTDIHRRMNAVQQFRI